MARSGLQETVGILDVLQTWNWDVLFARVPGSADARGLTTKCISTVLPGSQLEQVKLEAHGIQLNYAGRRVWTQTWDCTFVESRDANSRGLLIGWQEAARSWVNNSGSYKSQYAVPVQLTMYDDIPLQARLIQLENAFPINVGDATLDQSSGIVQYSVTFSYDYTTEI
jgi:hypothetical protein